MGSIYYRRFLLFICLFSSVCLAKPYFGVNLSIPIITKEPPTLHGYQLILSYDPQWIELQHFNLYFDGGLSHFWITNRPYHTALNIYSIAPVIRYSFKRQGLIS